MQKQINKEDVYSDPNCIKIHTWTVVLQCESRNYRGRQAIRNSNHTKQTEGLLEGGGWDDMKEGT